MSAAHKIESRTPLLGLGTVQFGKDYGFTRAKSQGEVSDLLAAAESLKVRLLDTARDYGDSEVKIGRYLKSRRGSAPFKIMTKITAIRPAIAGRPGALRKVVLKSVRDSLNALKVPSIDLLQLHQADPAITGNPRFWDLVEELKGSGRIRQFGVSVYEPAEASRLLAGRRGQLNVIQVPYSVLDRRFETLLKSEPAKGVRFVGRSAFLKGVLTADETRLPEELAPLREARSRFAKIAERSGWGVGEAALLYAATVPGIWATIVGVDSVRELRQNAAALRRHRDFLKIRPRFASLAVRRARWIDPRRWTSL